MIEDIKKFTAEIEQEIINIRRHLHQNPELSGEEHKTAEYISNILTKNSIKHELTVLEAGPVVIAEIHKSSELKTIAFRADMDALPLIECTDKPYCSKAHGVMHACGHDFNVASVLGTAIILNKIKDKIDLNIKFIFQPKEEKSESGAKAIVKAGLIKNIDAIWAIHAYPCLEAGKIGIRYGVTTASADIFEIEVIGKGGHSARPHQCIDSIYIMNKIINDFYSEISRKFDPIKPVIFTVGQITGGTAANIISEKCKCTGTVRTFEESIRKELMVYINKKASETAALYGATTHINWTYGPPSVINDEKLASITEKTATELIGASNTVILNEPSMGAEDFALYLEQTPGVLLRIGTGGNDCHHPLHSCYFDINEHSIPVTINLLSFIAVSYSLKFSNTEIAIPNTQ
ncbi:MAG: amidohydrolase [bacterium]